MFSVPSPKTRSPTIIAGLRWVATCVRCDAGAGYATAGGFLHPLRGQRRLLGYPVPVALIGRLAVDSEFQRKGLGSILLADACRKVVQASAVLAVAGIVADAKDDSAAAFYARFGFVRLPGQSDRLMLPAMALPP